MKLESIILFMIWCALVSIPAITTYWAYYRPNWAIRRWMNIAATVCGMLFGLLTCMTWFLNSGDYLNFIKPISAFCWLFSISGLIANWTVVFSKTTRDATWLVVCALVVYTFCPLILWFWHGHGH